MIAVSFPFGVHTWLTHTMMTAHCLWCALIRVEFVFQTGYFFPYSQPLQPSIGTLIWVIVHRCLPSYIQYSITLDHVTVLRNKKAEMAQTLQLAEQMADHLAAMELDEAQELLAAHGDFNNSLTLALQRIAKTLSIYRPQHAKTTEQKDPNPSDVSEETTEGGVLPLLGMVNPPAPKAQSASPPTMLKKASHPSLTCRPAFEKSPSCVAREGGNVFCDSTKCP